MTEYATPPFPAVEVTAEFYIAVNEDGDWTVGKDDSDVVTELRDDCGGAQIRSVRINLDISAVIPQPIEVEAALPRTEDGTFEMQIKS